MASSAGAEYSRPGTNSGPLSGIAPALWTGNRVSVAPQLVPKRSRGLERAQQKYGPQLHRGRDRKLSPQDGHTTLPIAPCGASRATRLVLQSVLI